MGAGHGGEMIAGLGGLVMVLIWLLLVGGWIIGAIVFLVAIWRWMRAHERVADGVQEMVEVLRTRGQ
ncbi:MAG: hypothetical protein ACOC7T_00975 [Planctomycetota bacterium]